MYQFAPCLRHAVLAACALSGFTGTALAQGTPPAEAPAAATTPAVPPVPPAAGRQTGKAAWQMLVGNTIVAKTRTGGYSEFYGQDGVVMHLDRDGTSIGRWKVEGQKICFDYPEEDDASCVSIELDGIAGAFIDDDGTRDTFDVTPGNPKNL